MTTLQDIWNTAIDITDFENSAFPSETIGVKYANAALRALHNAVVASSQDHFLSEQSISLVSDTWQYPLPADYQKTVKVTVTRGDRIYRVHPISHDDIDGLKVVTTTETLTHKYVHKPVEFEDMLGELPRDYPVGSEDFIMYHVAKQLAIKSQKQDVFQMLSAEERKLLEGILDDIEPRNEEEGQVADYYKRWNAVEYPQQTYWVYMIVGQFMEVYQPEWRGVE